MVACAAAPGGGRNGGYLTSMMSPDKYLKQFHPDYTDDKAALDKMIEDGGFDGWVKHFISKLSSWGNPDKPVLTAWHAVREATGPEWTIERNHYYHQVDPAGNQLPYIDRIHVRKHEGGDSIRLCRYIRRDRHADAQFYDGKDPPV